MTAIAIIDRLITPTEVLGLEEATATGSA